MDRIYFETCEVYGDYISLHIDDEDGPGGRCLAVPRKYLSKEKDETVSIRRDDGTATT